VQFYSLKRAVGKWKRDVLDEEQRSPNSRQAKGRQQSYFKFAEASQPKGGEFESNDSD